MDDLKLPQEDKVKIKDLIKQLKNIKKPRKYIGHNKTKKRRYKEKLGKIQSVEYQINYICFPCISKFIDEIMELKIKEEFNNFANINDIKLGDANKYE